jgi:hypothetical protein
VIYVSYVGNSIQVETLETLHVNTPLWQFSL